MDMTYERFVHAVARNAGIGKDAAKRATSATLETLGERLDARAARDLADKLPPELGALLVTVSDHVEFDLDEFLRRIADREDVDDATARRDAQALFQALADTIGLDELAELVALLSPDYEALLPHGSSDDLAAYERFLHRVYARGPFPDEDAARRAIDAVLETLGERLAHGEVEDLIALLPVELHPPLRRGDVATDGKAEQMTLIEFIERVDDRTGVGLETGEDYARAVLGTLRETIGDDEFADIASELPREYLDVLAVA
jgi:uncharacterized protein (DUF2267 family)